MTALEKLTGKTREFADACIRDNTVRELIEAANLADPQDLDEWNITAEQHKAAVVAAIEEKGWVQLDGNFFERDVVVSLMDDDIREALHSVASDWTEQQFLDAYVIKHREKHGHDFIVN